MIDFEAIEPGVYVYRWVGLVTMREAQQVADRLLAAHDGQPYAAIVDLRETEHLPRDFTHMRTIIRAEVAHGLQGYVVLGASRSIESLLRPLTLLAPTRYVFTQDWDKARTQARALLPQTQ